MKRNFIIPFTDCFSASDVDGLFVLCDDFLILNKLSSSTDFGFPEKHNTIKYIDI